jgi:acetyl-CoA acetyltransferase family protein
VVPVETEDGIIDRDEGPRSDTDLETLASLSAAFADDDAATVTPGNTSPLTDGTAGLLVTSARYANESDLDILANIRSRGVAGVDPTMMGTGPIPATYEALERTDLTVDELDLIEFNEAFASQNLYYKRELGIDDETLNANGGAIALGHPLGCSGARITTTLLHELQRLDGQYGLATMCVGFGQGVAAVFERP